jgi:hypothetical protein
MEELRSWLSSKGPLIHLIRIAHHTSQTINIAAQMIIALDVDTS